MIQLDNTLFSYTFLLLLFIVFLCLFSVFRSYFSAQIHVQYQHILYIDESPKSSYIKENLNKEIRALALVSHS